MADEQKPFQRLNTDKAYLLGLIIGGGEITGRQLTITLPYREWGNLEINPQRAGDISRDILSSVKPIWENEYGIDIEYKILNGAWQISGSVTDDLLRELRDSGLPTSGNFREQTDLSKLETRLDNADKKKRFVAGLTDTIGSLSRTHRHRVDSYQIISYEFKGRNFELVSQMAVILQSIGCYPDQILWNHPNFHSATDRYYKSWKKGFKIRVALSEYMLAGSFVSKAKKLSADENMRFVNNNAARGEDRVIRVQGRTALHRDENSEKLPEKVRGRHFIHYAHLAAFMGVPLNEDWLDVLRSKLRNAESLVTPFTLLTKGTKSDIEKIIRQEPYLRKSDFYTVEITGELLERILQKWDESADQCVLGIDDSKGFPAGNAAEAIVYVALAERGGEGLFGKRIRGNLREQFVETKSFIAGLNVVIHRPEKGTCLIVNGENYAALVGYVDDDFNRGLIEYDEGSLELKINEPDYEDCIDID